jgi:hypothetical protein
VADEARSFSSALFSCGNAVQSSKQNARIAASVRHAQLCILMSLRTAACAVTSTSAYSMHLTGTLCGALGWVRHVMHCWPDSGKNSRFSLLSVSMHHCIITHDSSL